MIKTREIHQPVRVSDGYRILVEPLWPRGISPVEARIDAWMKEVAPGEILRQWFEERPDQWKEFVNRYEKELRRNEEFIQQLIRLEKRHESITLVHASREERWNGAMALMEILNKKKAKEMRAAAR